MASSVDDREPEAPKRKKEKNRKPADTPFRQQRLKAWHPILTPRTVLPLFFAIGIVFGPIGGLLLWASAQIQELVIDYTRCIESTGKELTTVPSSAVKSSFTTSLAPEDLPKWSMSTRPASYNPDEEERVCTIEFTIPNEMKAPVLMYYRLTNFYQNHRRYVISLDEKQLKGEPRSYQDLDGSDDCAPLAGAGGVPYYPCGLVANSMFNDTFTSPVSVLDGGNSSGEEYFMTTKGIAWGSDKKRYKKTRYRPDQVIPPRNWVKRFPNNYTEETMPDINQWEEFQVWMRAAGLPTFSKLARRNDTLAMPAGKYRVDITYNFEVMNFTGTKSIMLSTRTVMGGRNPFLGIAYVVVAGLCVVLGTLFTARHFWKPRKLGDPKYLTWNNEPTSGSHAPAPVGQGT
ncbi:ligand-effect modulator 3 family [Tuber borchii]|uniref:Ligand-effect modulator 3 family n=1 Tax=Tuber borchii TaxID=42251 RepID=A0A2T6ZU24_TUBBO|nr:ligand-effect modulator 3 family [Tuber borchii]